MRYTATPKALKDYNNDQTTTITEDLTNSETRISVTDSTSLPVNSRIVIGSEIMKVSEVIDAITIIAKRGFDSSIATEHISGSTINLLTTEDDAQVVPGDDFGFNEFEEFFDDGFTYSPSKQTDV